MPFFFVPFKNLVRRKVRSTLTALGIAMAVATVVSLVGFAMGLEQSSVEVYRGHDIDLVVLRSGVTERLTSNLDEKLAGQLTALPGIAAVNPSLTDLVSFGGGSLIGIPVHGWPPDGFAVGTLQIISGRRLSMDDRNAVMLGKALADSLRKHVSDRVEIENQEFLVVGTFRGANLFEDTTAVVPLADLQRLMDRPAQVTEFQIKLDQRATDHRATIAALRQQIAQLRNAQYKRLGLIAIPTQEYITASSEIKLVRGMAAVTSLIALVIGSIGMLNTMFMSVLERTQEIGTLRAIGWRKSRVLRMILAESLLLSMIGGLVGIVFAWMLMQVLSHSSSVQGLIRPELSLSVVWQGLLLATIAGAAGGLYPAFRGTRVAPSEALRYE
jgi:putative ABC transport system permease protein